MTEQSSPFALSSIGQVAVNVHDVGKATVFYRDTLGMKFLFAAGDMAFFDCDGVRLMLSAARETGVRSPELDHLLPGCGHPAGVRDSLLSRCAL